MENETQLAASPDISELQAQYQWLRKQIVTVLILMIVVSGTLSIYLLRQSTYASHDLKMISPEAAQIIPQYTKNGGPAMDQIVSKLTDYAKSHPGFAPILAKYGVNVTNAAASAPVTAPAAIPPALKK